MVPDSARAFPHPISESVNAYGVNDYSQCRGAGADLPEPATNAVLFAGNLLAFGFVSHQVPLTFGNVWLNGNVQGTDFYDPQLTGSSSDRDQFGFDAPGTAFAYFSGHGRCMCGNTDQDQWCVDHSIVTGVCGDFPLGETTVYCHPDPADSSKCVKGQVCHHNSDCTQPPGKQVFPGPFREGAFCNHWPGDSYGTCSYTMYNRALFPATCPFEGHDGVEYSQGSVAWGESASSGPWRGAGTNGGANVVGVAASCSVLSLREHEVLLAFGGMHLFLGTMVHNDDEISVLTRGENFAYHVLVPQMQVGEAWSEAMAGLPGRSDNCTGRNGTFVAGGGQGFSGCGGHITIAAGATPAEANAHLAESFLDATKDANDGRGASIWASEVNCNWDCWAEPMDLP